MFDSPQVLSVVNDSIEELNGEMVSEDFDGIRNEGDSLSQRYFVQANDVELAEICCETV